MSTTLPLLTQQSLETKRLEKLGLPWQIAAFLISCAAIVSRRPDAVFHAQFYAEDGVNWFADAYNRGWLRALFIPYQGYLHLVPRLASALAQLVPFLYAPLVQNLIAIAIQALPVCLLLSPRSQGWGSLRFRFLLAFLYLFLPNTAEMMGSVTESQWILTLCALLLLVGLPPRSKPGWAAGITLIILCSFTGPFCLFLLPMAVFLLWRGRWEDRWLRTATLLLLLGSIVQGFCLLAHHSVRHQIPLGTSLKLFARILGGQIYLGTLLGGNQLSAILSVRALTVVSIIGTLIILACLRWIKRREMRLLIILSALLFAAALCNPVLYAPPSFTGWYVLSVTQLLKHYWFFPTLAFAWSLVYCFFSGRQGLQIVSGICLFFMLIGLVRDHHYQPFRDLNYPAYARQFDSSPSGTIITIPIYPGGDWAILKITKH